MFPFVPAALATCPQKGRMGEITWPPRVTPSRGHTGSSNSPAFPTNARRLIFSNAYKLGRVYRRPACSHYPSESMCKTAPLDILARRGAITAKLHESYHRLNWQGLVAPSAQSIFPATSVLSGQWVPGGSEAILFQVPTAQIALSWPALIPAPILEWIHRSTTVLPVGCMDMTLEWTCRAMGIIETLCPPKFTPQVELYKPAPTSPPPPTKSSSWHNKIFLYLQQSGSTIQLKFPPVHAAVVCCWMQPSLPAARWTPAERLVQQLTTKWDSVHTDRRKS